MEFEGSRVLSPRRNITRQWKDKEWWYTGFFDSPANIYLSFFFIRTAITDHFSFTLFDPSQQSPVHFEKNLFLQTGNEKDRTYLKHVSGGLAVEYLGDAETGWKFNFRNEEYSIDLVMQATICGFSKFDNYFVNQYGLVNYFHNNVNGTIRLPGKTYTINNAQGYYDHCFGRVPRKSGWHWLAVQNEKAAIDSLVNYGQFAQKYTQVFFKDSSRGFTANEWIRLSQEVSFEHYPANDPSSDWKITSIDLDLTLTPLMHICNINRIPPLVPFLINITHYEFFVKVRGKVCIDSKWAEVEDLYGVLEEHHGKW